MRIVYTLSSQTSAGETFLRVYTCAGVYLEDIAYPHAHDSAFRYIVYILGKTPRAHCLHGIYPLVLALALCAQPITAKHIKCSLSPLPFLLSCARCRGTNSAHQLKIRRTPQDQSSGGRTQLRAGRKRDRKTRGEHWLSTR